MRTVNLIKLPVDCVLFNTEFGIASFFEFFNSIMVADFPISKWHLYIESSSKIIQRDIFWWITEKSRFRTKYSVQMFAGWRKRGEREEFNILSTCVTREHDPRPRLRLCYRPSVSQVESCLRDLLFAERFVICASPSSGALCAFRIEISGRFVEPRYSLHRDGVSPQDDDFRDAEPSRTRSGYKDIGFAINIFICHTIFASIWSFENLSSDDFEMWKLDSPISTCKRREGSSKKKYLLVTKTSLWNRL